MYQRIENALDTLQHPFLLIVRLVWGYQFLITGWGKLGNIEGVTRFFTSLGIPMPGANAVLVASTEFLGGILLLLGLASRPAALPLTITMMVALSVEDGVFASVDTFVASDPFPFLMASLIVLVFGPGMASLDEVLKRFVFNSDTQTDSDAATAAN